jgi:hypothetical protein
VKLAVANEVYRTRTRDNIHLVYRRSRVGESPPVDPFYDWAKRVRQHGFNSPFEEVAIAELLRQYGISTIYPRAIYRTGHQAVKPFAIRDDRRYVTHAELITPDSQPERALVPDYDYYTIWGYFRGISPQKDYRTKGHWGFVDLEKALEDEVINKELSDKTITETRRRLTAVGLPEETIDDFEFLLEFDQKGSLIRDERGRLEVSWALDALAAHQYDLLDESSYRTLVLRTHDRIKGAGCEALDLSGHHLLLSLDPDGCIRTDSQGEPDVTLCNLELIRGISCML